MPLPSDNIDSYFNEYQRAGALYRPTRFQFYIPQLPFKLGVVSTDFRKDFQFALDTVFFPGRNISSEPLKIAGPIEEIPYEATYSGDLDLGVRLSGDFKEKALFESWMDLVLNQRTQDLQYPDAYRCDAFVHGLDLKNQTTYILKLVDVWPKSVARVTAGQGLMNSVANMQIQLGWRRYYPIYLEKTTYHGPQLANFVKDKVTALRNQGAIENLPSGIEIPLSEGQPEQNFRPNENLSPYAPESGLRRSGPSDRPD